MFVHQNDCTSISPHHGVSQQEGMEGSRHVEVCDYRCSQPRGTAGIGQGDSIIGKQLEDDIHLDN